MSGKVPWPLFPPFFFSEPDPIRRSLRLRLSSVKQIVHGGEDFPRQPVSDDEGHDDPVRERPRMAPRADPHADIAVRSHLAPVLETCLFIQFPSQGAVDDRLAPHGN